MHSRTLCFHVSEQFTKFLHNLDLGDLLVVWEKEVVRRKSLDAVRESANEQTVIVVGVTD